MTTAPTTTADAASLSRLQDIIAPPPVPWWPPAPGWFVLAGGAAVLGGLFVVAWIRWRQLNRYRRVALRELDWIQHRLGEPAAGANEIAVLLKRVALSGFPRDVVASLGGDAWIDFLSRTDRRLDLDPLTRKLLLTSAFARPAAGPDDTATLLSLTKAVRHWIVHHRQERE